MLSTREKHHYAKRICSRPIGGDFGGSIRIPAHFCGIHGLKPTARRLPNDDTPVMDFFEMGQQAIIPQPGPMARTVDDLVLAMSILAGPYDEPLLDRVPPVPWAGPEGIDVSSLRIGVFDDNGGRGGAYATHPAVYVAARWNRWLSRHRLSTGP